MAPPPVREAPPRGREADIPRGRRGVFPDVDAAVKAARAAHEANEAAPLEAHKRWVDVMRETARKLVPALARYAVEETAYGRVEDKLKKNMLCVDKTPGTELLQPIAWSGDDGLTLTERASYGVIGSITPTTPAGERRSARCLVADVSSACRAGVSLPTCQSKRDGGTAETAGTG